MHVSQVVEANAGLIAHLGEQADEFGSETDGVGAFVNWTPFVGPRDVGFKV